MYRDKLTGPAPVAGRIGGVGMKHRSLQERLIAEAESLRAGVPTQATCDGISRLLVEAAAAVESPAMTDTKALLELAEEIEAWVLDSRPVRIRPVVEWAERLRALAAHAPAADAQQAVVVDEEWHPLYGKTPKEAWRNGFQSGVDRAQGSIFMPFKDAAEACNAVGIVNPHRQNVEGMQALVESLCERIRATARRILSPTTGAQE